MYKFRNPGTTLNTLTNNFKAFYDELKHMQSFNLEELAIVLTNNNLMTSYGFSGEKALEKSNTDDVSRNSTQMNVKMYAEILRMLGWVTSETSSSSYPLVFTILGIQVANSDILIIQQLYEKSVQGIVNPNEILNVKYDENTRIFISILNSIVHLGGYIYKHEMCMLPMSYDDNHQNFIEIKDLFLNERKTLKYNEFKDKFTEFSKGLRMASTSVDNCTRMPIAMLKQCGYVKEAKEKIYGRYLSVLSITEKGKCVLSDFSKYKDLRLKEFNGYTINEQEAAIRLGYLNMLEEAGLDINGYIDVVAKDEIELSGKLDNKKLFFSPYQTINGKRVNEVLEKMFGIEKASKKLTDLNISKNDELAKPEVLFSDAISVLLIPGKAFEAKDSIQESIIAKIEKLFSEGNSKIQLLKC